MAIGGDRWFGGHGQDRYWGAQLNRYLGLWAKSDFSSFPKFK
jgi:hypothetical protein